MTTLARRFLACPARLALFGVGTSALVACTVQTEAAALGHLLGVVLTIALVIGLVSPPSVDWDHDSPPEPEGRQPEHVPMFPSLAPALAFLQSSAPVTIVEWTPGPGPLGHANGTWGQPSNLAKPYTVDVPTGTRAVYQTTGGEVVTADLAVYCRSSAAPAEPADGGRQPRLTW